MFNFVQDFNKFDGLEGYDFVLLINRNKRLFEQEIKQLQDVREDNPKFNQYKEKTKELLVKYSDKKPDGSPIIDPLPGQPVQGNYRLTTNREVFNTEHLKLIEKYKDDIDRQNKLDQDFNESMNKTIFIKPYNIKEELLPKNIKSEQMNLLFPLITFKPDQREEPQEPVLKKAL